MVHTEGPGRLRAGKPGRGLGRGGVFCLPRYLGEDLQTCGDLAGHDVQLFGCEGGAGGGGVGKTVADLFQSQLRELDVAVEWHGYRLP